MLTVENYLETFRMWPKIVQYVLDHSEKYPLVPMNDKITTSEQQVLKTLKNLSLKRLKPYSEHDTFRHALESLYKQTTTYLSEDNIYRLLFVLKLPDDTAASKLLTVYLNTNDLTARNIEHFTIICALRLHLSWKQTRDLMKEHIDTLFEQPPASKNIVEFQTYDFYQRIVSSKIHTKNDLEKELSNELHRDFWAKTGNTRYFALFGSIQWNDFNSINLKRNSRANVKLYDMALAMAKSCKEQHIITHKKEYAKLFGLHSVDDTNDIPRNSFLSFEEIHTLSQIFPTVFLTWGTYCDLLKRKGKDVPQGTYILRMLSEMDPGPTKKQTMMKKHTPYREEEYVDFTNREAWLSAIDNYLIGAGFPIFQPSYGFNKLVLDVYDETLSENPNSESPVIKRLFFEKLRFYLKQIAALPQ